jgi:tetratricopeptide (TPR) repeat protein
MYSLDDRPVKGTQMNQKIVRTAAMLGLVAACALFLASAEVRAQEAGGDLGGGAGIFRPKNPETSSRRRTRTTPLRPRTSSNRTSNRSAAEIDAEVEDLLDAGNEARDARKYSEAETNYRNALKLSARNWRAQYGLGNVYTDQQRWDEAEQAYRQAAALNLADADTQIALSYVLLQPHSGGSQAKRLADAETAARRAISVLATNAVAYDRLGAAMEARGLLAADTEQAYRKAIELDPQFAVAYVHLARHIRKDPKRAAEAEPLYGKALELAKDAPTLILIADALQSEQRYLDSEKPLNAALQIDARNPNALFLMGRMQVVLKHYSEAEPFLQKAIEVSPKSFEPYQVLASAYLRENRFEDAEQILMKASVVAPAASRRQLAGSYGFSGIGDGYAGAGRTKDAIRAYQAALKLDPQNTELQRKLAGLSASPN